MTYFILNHNLLSQNKSVLWKTVKECESIYANAMVHVRK